jgi:AAA domain, putative AbiEii toxin, Type IV TA system
LELRFQRSYLSIVEFPTVTLPDFTLLTGVNGVGKTHLLQAIGQGCISVDVAPNAPMDTRYFDWLSLFPNDLSVVNSAAVNTSRAHVIQLIQSTKLKYQGELAAAMAGYGVIQRSAGDIWTMAALDAQSLSTARQRAKRQTSDPEGFARIQRVVATASEAVVAGLQGPHFQSLRERLSKLKPAILLSAHELDNVPFAWWCADPFKQSFGEMFFAYFQLERANLLAALEKNKGQQVDPAPLTDEEFREHHGEPPWVLVNDIFRAASLDFKLSHPTDYRADQFTPRLTKVSSGMEVTFSSLSSGERILMALALSLYYCKDTRQLMQPPKLLLFDEIDAPLHPSMCRQLFRAITDALMSRGVHVIMATHAPTTVALAPSDCVYVMRPAQPGVHKTTQQQAIVALTEGIPTLSISFHGRRQVLVESEYDAKRYDALYGQLRVFLDSELSLQFIPVGRRDQQTGSDQVRTLVELLAEKGNESVFGLLDWDLKNEPSGRVHVLAHDERYAIENCLLDPLLVAAAAIREEREIAKELLLPSTTTYASLGSLLDPQKQAAVDAVQRKVLGLSNGAELADCHQVGYFGGFQLELSRSYLRKNGHDLEEAVKAAFPCLRRYHKTGELLLHIVDNIIADCRAFTPESVVNAFNTLLQAR